MVEDTEFTHEGHAIYNIGAVTRMTEIPVATLRAWERRYDFPQPVRTPGGHRLYTEEEIQRLQWVKARLEEGMQVSHAIEALQARESTLQRLEISAPPPVISPPIMALPGSDSPLTLLRERLEQALLANHPDIADRIMGEALALYSVEDLIFGMIAPVLRNVGEAWVEGRVSIAAEHLITQHLRHRLVMWLESGPPPYNVPATVLACAPDEWHESSLLMLGVLLRRRRWPIIYLGQAVPLPDLANFVQQTHPLAVVLVAMREESAATLITWPHWLPDAAKIGRPLIAFGGRVFTEHPVWRERVPGEYLGDDLHEGVAHLEHLLQTRVS